MRISQIAVLTLVMLFGFTASAYATVQAIADAKQAQGQGQKQSVTDSGNSQISGSGNSTLSGSGNSAVSDVGKVTIEDSFNGGDPIRYLPVPTHVSVTTAGGPGFFGEPDYADKGPHFMSMTALVTVLNLIDSDEAVIKDDGDITIVAQMLNALSAEEKKAVRDKGEKPKFFLNTEADVTSTVTGFKAISVVTIHADDNNTMNSATLAVKLRKHADKVGGDTIIVVTEGSTKRVSSWGVGIGFSANYASVGSDADDNGSVGAGGTGWSWGEGEYFSLPYLTAVVGYR